MSDIAVRANINVEKLYEFPIIAHSHEKMEAIVTTLNARLAGIQAVNLIRDEAQQSITQTLNHIWEI